MTPWLTSTSASTTDSGTSTYSVERVTSTQKLPMVCAVCRANPRITATATTNPVAADRKFWTARPAICTR